jgi:hypothetical protein
VKCFLSNGFPCICKPALTLSHFKPSSNLTWLQAHCNFMTLMQIVSDLPTTIAGRPRGMLMVSCRVDAFVVCKPGTYRLQTGQGPLTPDPACKISHCKMLKQTTLATLLVVSCQPCSVSEPASCSAHGVFSRLLTWALWQNYRAPEPMQFIVNVPKCCSLHDLPAGVKFYIKRTRAAFTPSLTSG